MAMTAIATHLNVPKCDHEEHEERHPSITALSFMFTSPSPTSKPAQIGFIDAQLLHKTALEPTDSPGMWAECRAFDIAHCPEAKLHKVENYLSNECFPDDKQALIDAANWLLYVEKVYLHPEYRGRALGLVAADAAIRALRLDRERCVVMLEPGPVVLGERQRIPGAFEYLSSHDTGSRRTLSTEKLLRVWHEDTTRGRPPVHAQLMDWEASRTAHPAMGVMDGSYQDDREVGAGDATEKIARHWRRLGFEACSYTDESWISLSTRERPSIKDVLGGQVL